MLVFAVMLLLNCVVSDLAESAVNQSSIDKFNVTGIMVLAVPIVRNLYAFAANVIVIPEGTPAELSGALLNKEYGLG